MRKEEAGSQETCEVKFPKAEATLTPHNIQHNSKKNVNSATIESIHRPTIQQYNTSIASTVAYARARSVTGSVKSSGACDCLIPDNAVTWWREFLIEAQYKQSIGEDID
jgi:hypothetical protein